MSTKFNLFRYLFPPFFDTEAFIQKVSVSLSVINSSDNTFLQIAIEIIQLLRNDFFSEKIVLLIKSLTWSFLV